MTFKDLTESKTGTYAGCTLSENTLLQIASSLNIPNIISENALHTTLLYSRKFIPELKGSIDVNYIAVVEGFELFGENKEILVLKLKSPDLTDRHTELMTKYEATYDYPEYIPHITLSYNIEDYNTDNFDVSKFNEDLIFNKEYYEDLDFNKYS